MAFEKFESGEGIGRGAETEPKISLRKSGSIGLNRVAVEEFFEDAEKAVMYYDEDNNQVGIEPVEDPDDEDGYTITKSNGSGSITPSAFLRRYDLVPERTMQFRPELVKVNQNLEVVAFTASEDSAGFVGYYGSPDDDEDE